MTGKAPSKTMGATTDGPRDVDGCDDGGKGREGSQGKRLSFELRLPLSIPPKELGSLDYILSLGDLRCPRTCVRSSPHGAAPQRPKTRGDGRVPPKRGTKWLRNEGRRACDAKMRHQMAQKRSYRIVEKQAAFETKAENGGDFPLDSAALDSPNSRA